MSHLVVETNFGKWEYDGEDAIKVYNAINNAGARGAGWATVTISNGYYITFILRNISYFAFK